MKARFNYDLSEVKEILQLARSLQTIAEPTRGLVSDDRQLERQLLIDRADHLIKLMEKEKEKARGAQSNLSITRAMNLLKAS